MGLLSKLVAGFVLVLIVYVAVGGAMTAIAGNPKPRGQLYDIGGGRRMHMVCAGPAKADGPTVLLEAGAFGFSADWGVVQDKLAAKGIRSCAYDRAGLGFSDPGPKPRDGLAVEDDLEKLLAAAGEKGPFILCGHSMAGLRLRLFAARNPGMVKGVVLVDATTPEAMDNKVMRGFVQTFSNLSRLAAVGAGAGLFKPLVYTSYGDKIGLGREALGLRPRRPQLLGRRGGSRLAPGRATGARGRRLFTRAAGGGDHRRGGTGRGRGAGGMEEPAGRPGAVVQARLCGARGRRRPCHPSGRGLRRRHRAGRRARPRGGDATSLSGRGGLNLPAVNGLWP